MTNVLDTNRPRLLLVGLCLLLWLPGFFALPPGDRDESRFVQATKQMLETGDYVRIMNGTEARNRKPIGIHWLQAPFAAAARAAGVAGVWPYRVPSLLGGVVAVLACFAVGERLVGRRAALLGAGALAASVALVVEVHIAKTDAALLGATTVAMALLGRAYLDPGGMGRGASAGFWLAMGVGILLKGPITPMVAGLAVVGLLVADRGRGRPWLGSLRAGWGVPLLLLVVVPWFVAIGAATGGRFFSEAVGGDLGRKLTSGDDSHWGPPGLYLLLLPVLLFPLSAALPGGFAVAWRERAEPRVRFLLAWVVPAWLVFEAVPTKLPHYTLPLYPAVCLLMAHGVMVGYRSRLGAWLAGLVAVGLAAGCLAAGIVLGVGWWLGVPAVLAAVAVGWWAVRARGVRGAVGAVALAVPLYAAVLGWEAPRLIPLWIAPRVVAVLPPGRLGAIGFAEPSLMVLAGTGTLWLRAEAGVAALTDGTVASLMVSDRDLATVRADAAARHIVLREGAVVRGFNVSRGRWVALTVVTIGGGP